jgi:DNA processing protein
MAESQLVYEYCVAHFARLDLPSALKFVGRFPTFSSWSALSTADRSNVLAKLLGKGTANALAVSFDEHLDRANEDIQGHELLGIHVLSLSSPSYPPLLGKISNPPPVVFYQGVLECLSEARNAAVVGTREPTCSGEQMAWKIANWLNQDGWCVVSGLAKGIDTAAHRGALDSKQSKTAAVMPAPLNQIYPEENRPLA